MKIFAIPFMLAVLSLFAGTAVVPTPAHACNIPNPPPACANLPGSNKVNGTGTLFQNQFQGVPGAFQAPGGPPFGSGGGGDPFFVEDRFQFNDGWSFGTPPAGSASTGNTGDDGLTPQERNIRANAQRDAIDRTFNRDYRTKFEKEFYSEIGEVIRVMLLEGIGFPEGFEGPGQFLEESEARPGGTPTDGEGVNTPREEDSGGQRPEGEASLYGARRDADLETVDENNDSIMGELESFFVKM